MMNNRRRNQRRQKTKAKTNFGGHEKDNFRIDTRFEREKEIPTKKN